jgi:hypothetical protein
MSLFLVLIELVYALFAAVFCMSTAGFICLPVPVA